MSSNPHILTLKGLMSYLSRVYICIDNVSTRGNVSTFTAYPAGSEWRKVQVKAYFNRDTDQVYDIDYINRSNTRVPVYSVDMELDPEVSVYDLLFGFVHAIENN